MTAAELDKFYRRHLAAEIAGARTGLQPLSEEERRDWWDLTLWLYSFFESLLKDNRIDRNQAAQIGSLNWLLAKASFVFATPVPAFIGLQHRYVEILVCVATAFSVIVDEPKELRKMSRDYYGVPSNQIPALSEAFIVNNLRNWKDWRNADAPVGWIKAQTDFIHEKDHVAGGVIRESDALYGSPEDAVGGAVRQVVPVEEISETPAEAGFAHLECSSRYGSISIRELIKAINQDDDLVRYFELKRRGLKPKYAWARLGWDPQKGKAVDRRLRRARTKLKMTGFEFDGREIGHPPGVTEANCTVVKEHLHVSLPRGVESTLSGRVAYEPKPVDHDRSENG